jgi:hypothetical protein
VATAVGAGRFRVTGLYASMAGDWRVRVDAGGAPAVFTLPITTTPPEPGKAPQPPIKGSTWAWGFGELAIVLAALLGAARVSGRITARRANRRARVLA